MNQPDLGITIAELRVQKGFTQEKLAEYCEVSKRTIQRIENGEVEPRAFTLNNLSNILEFDFVNDNTQHETTWVTILHLSCCLIFTIIIVPLLIWSGKKKQSHKIDQHGRVVLNFQVTITLMLFVSLLFLLILLGTAMVMDETNVGASDLVFTGMMFLGLLPFILIGMFSAFQGIVNALRMLSDKPIRYRLSIPFVK
jgi:uncharacterized Tic20 family protein